MAFASASGFGGFLLVVLIPIGKFCYILSGMKLYTPIELALFALSVLHIVAGIVIGESVGLRLAGVGVLCWLVLTTLMLYRLFAYLLVVAKSASAMENINRVIDSLLVSPASRASRQAREHAAERPDAGR